MTKFLGRSARFLAVVTLAVGSPPVLAQSATPAPVQTPAPIMTPAGTTPAPATPLPVTSPPASPSPSPSASPMSELENPPENSLVTARVREQFLAWGRGRIDRATYSAYAGGTYYNALVRVVSPYLTIGEPQTFTYRTASLLLGDLVYRYDITGPSGAVSVLYSLDQNGKTDGIVFTPRVFRSGSGSP